MKTAAHPHAEQTSAGWGPLWRFVGRRLVLGVVVLGAVSAIVFTATELATGDAATASLGSEATPE
ncbi:hypothetical protein ACFXCO_15075, partial [Streptomyces hygroscopicus]